MRFGGDPLGDRVVSGHDWELIDEPIANFSTHKCKRCNLEVSMPGNSPQPEDRVYGLSCEEILNHHIRSVHDS